jgi:hypothetical protein
MRSGAIAAPGRVHVVLPGGLVIESSWPWPRGAAVEVQLPAGPAVEVTIVGERGDVYVARLPSDSEAFVDELRTRIES